MTYAVFVIKKKTLKQDNCFGIELQDVIRMPKMEEAHMPFSSFNVGHLPLLK